MDTRTEINSILKKLEFSSGQSLKKIIACLAAAVIVGLLPSYTGLSAAGHWTLFILILAAGLWITEAIPAFAVGLLVIGLQIAILGRPNGVFAKGPQDWQMFIQPWASPLIWLFFGGFVLAKAIQSAGIDRIFARRIIHFVGQKPATVLLAVMAITFSFSMFMSNTATAAMMVGMVTSVIGSIPNGDPFSKALLLGIAFSANLGGMATIIGSPPNAIAIGALGGITPVSFVKWMTIGLPPALVMAWLIWFYLLKRYPATSANVDLSGLEISSTEMSAGQPWKRILVLGTFILTVVLWMTGPVHNIPTTVVSFIPIIVFTAIGVIGVKEIRGLHWDVLLLIAGGLSLGIGVSETGLAKWIVGLLPTDRLGVVTLGLMLAYFCGVLSNFMSNTAAANILIPVALAISVGFEIHVVVPVALSASAAMCLPISTPPNAIVFSSGQLKSKDFIEGGIMVGIIAPVITVFWCNLIN